MRFLNFKKKKVSKKKVQKDNSQKSSKKKNSKKSKDKEKLRNYSQQDPPKKYNWKGKKLEDMDKPEKKNFLDMDMTERMIRTEQKVAASFGEKIPYKKTEYYSSLSDEEKKRFKKHLKKRGKRGPMLVLGVLASGTLLTVLGLSLNNPQTIQLTGNAIQKTQETTGLGMNELSLVGMVLLVAAFTGIFVFVSSLIFNRKKQRRFDGHMAVIDRVLSKKYNK